MVRGILLLLGREGVWICVYTYREGWCSCRAQNNVSRTWSWWMHDKERFTIMVWAVEGDKEKANHKPKSTKNTKQQSLRQRKMERNQYIKWKKWYKRREKERRENDNSVKVGLETREKEGVVLPPLYKSCHNTKVVKMPTLYQVSLSASNQFPHRKCRFGSSHARTISRPSTKHYCAWDSVARCILSAWAGTWGQRGSFESHSSLGPAAEGVSRLWSFVITTLLCMCHSPPFAEQNPRSRHEEWGWEGEGVFAGKFLYCFTHQRTLNSYNFIPLRLVILG